MGFYLGPQSLVRLWAERLGNETDKDRMKATVEKMKYQQTF